ncbi:hypothetical protein U0021_09015 [Moraxella canis]|uniref:Uncharacterized protein n=1 Tax=Moraxella canis TaxID=90239 RepID=A0ABZ0WXS2_9GAMM|nr:hypothetical protein [Moraxella canis]WQE03862.1 hypothetical protein U0021_09015 [Moraxella canis]
MIDFDFDNEKILDSLEATLIRDNLSDLYIDLQKPSPENIKKQFSISFFDHILSEQEYINAKFVCYSDITESSSDHLIEEINKVMNDFLYVYGFLFDINDGFVYIDNNSSIIKTHNKDLYTRNVINGLKERPLCVLVFSNLKLTVEFGYDLTHHFYLADDAYFEKIKEVVLLNKLFII